MLNLKYLIIASIQSTQDRKELEDKLNLLPGSWDVINLDGTLTSVHNNSTDESISKDDTIKLAYIKAIKDSHKDNRTYLQVDTMEVYIKYHILKNPTLFIADAINFTNLEMGFDIENIVQELGVSKKNIMYRIKI